MEIILLSIIAGTLIVKLIFDGMDTDKLSVLIPFVVIAVFIASAVMYTITWVIYSLLEMFGFYLS